MSTCTTPSRLLSLPKELQLTIWEYSLIEPDPIPFFKVSAPKFSDIATMLQRKDALQFTVPALLQTCRSSRVEGVPIYYGNNTFVLRYGTAFGRYDEIHALFTKYWAYLMLVKSFGIEYKLPTGTKFLLQGNRKFTTNEMSSKLEYSFDFKFDAAPSQQRPMTAFELWETDGCLCMIDLTIRSRYYRLLADYTKAMIAFLASFGANISRNDLRIKRPCKYCGKGMLEQKPRYR